MAQPTSEQPSNEQEPAAQGALALNGNAWLAVQGQGYQLQIQQYSNKGPLFVVQDAAGNELGRARFDLATGQWQTSSTN